MKKAIILGSHSFDRVGVKVGLQHIAQHLALSDYQVDYISVPSSPVDMLSKITFPRFVKAWFDFGNNIEVQKNLTEHFIKAPWTTSKATFKYKWQIKLYSIFLPTKIKNTKYDLLVHDVSTSSLLSDTIHAKHKVFRVNDSPRGFVSHVGETVVDWFEQKLKNAWHDEIWVSSKVQLEEIISINNKLTAILIPNGYDTKNYVETEKLVFPLEVVFVGAISEWLDTELIEETALLMPDWTFKIYGPNFVKYEPKPKNVILMGPIDNSEVTSTINSSSVGIIPYKNIGHVSKIERPIKYYEYLAAKLGIVVTDIPSFRKGMGDDVFYGSTPTEFSSSIILAHQAAPNITSEYVKMALNNVSWSGRFKKIDSRLEQWK
jgi:hypothetical protein